MTPDQNGIFLTKKQASITATTLVLLGLLLFVAGYFWGKQSVIDGFAQRTSQESFNDQVDCLLTMQSYAAKTGNSSNIDSGAEQSVLDVDDQAESIIPQEPIVEDSRSVEVLEKANQVASQNSVLKPKKHFATLAGFSKKSLAEQMVARLKKRNIEVLIKTKTGKSSSGKTQKIWYQVVTKSYDSIENVQNILKKILKSEKIKASDIKIL